MPERTAFFIMTLIAALGAIAMFIAAIRTSYAIEQRSDGTTTWKGAPRFTNMVRTLFAGDGIARDDETRALVKVLRKQVAFAGVFLVLLAITVHRFN